MDSLRFFFIELLHEEITEVATAWNKHIISHHRNSGPTGQPDVMFLLPHTYDTKDHLQYDSDEDIDEFQCVKGQLLDGFSDDFREFSFYFIDQECFEMPTSISGCLDYTFLWNTHKITVPETKINLCVFLALKTPTEKYFAKVLKLSRL